jgi:uncharacterized protein with GYD domain
MSRTESYFRAGQLTSMPTYVSLIHWTDQGIKNYKDSPSRAADFTKLAESSGGRVRELLWTVGEYDLLSVVDFPDDETATAAPASGSVSRQHPLEHDAGLQRRRDDHHHREDRLSAAPSHPRAPAPDSRSMAAPWPPGLARGLGSEPFPACRRSRHAGQHDPQVHHLA